jgi:hypothetical protein
MRNVLWFGLCVALVGLGLPSRIRAEGVTPGDIVVSDFGGPGTGYQPSLVIIDPRTGKQSLLSVGVGGSALAFDRLGHRFILTGGATVDATTGALSQSAGFPGFTAIAIEAPQQYLLLQENGSLLHGRLVRYNERTNTLTVVAEGGLIGGVEPWSVEVRQDGQIFVSSLPLEGLDVPGLPTRVIQIDPTTGAQSLVLESLDLDFRDFLILGNELIIGTEPRGGPFGLDTVSRLDIQTGLLTPIYSGLQRVLDVDQLTDGRLVVLDQILTLDDIRSPVVYKAHKNHLTPLSTYGFMSIPARAVVVQCFEDDNCTKNGSKPPQAFCNLQGTCEVANESGN